MGSTNARAVARPTTVCALALALGFPACGKRGDPLPPLRRTPQPVTNLRVAQRGRRVEVSYVAPRATADGARLPVLEVELLRADRSGDFEKTARAQVSKAAPGEAFLAVEDLPAAGTSLRFAARAVAQGHPSPLTPIVTLHVQAPPPAPTDLSAEVVGDGVVVKWSGTAPVPGASPSPVPAPALTPTSSPPAPSPSPAASPTGLLPAPTGSPSPAASATPNPSPTPSPTPPPPPTSGFWLYRRAKSGVYAAPLTPYPLAVSPFADATAAPGESWCYVVRTVVSTDPVIESAESQEACVSVTDVKPPAAPQGLAALLRDGGVDLSWSASPEPDLLHYRVYRSVVGGSPERIGVVPAGQTAFRDATLAHGQIYHYTVTAVDKAGNESPPSSPVEGSIP